MSKETNAVFRLLTSLKLTLVLFLLLAAASVLGTILPQGANPADLKAHFGPTLGPLLETLQLNDLFHSAWFSGLLLLLGANLVACTLDRLPKTVRILRKPQAAFDSRKLSNFSLSRAIATTLPFETTRSLVESVVGQAFGQMSPIESDAGFCTFHESGRWTRLMVHVAHLSVLVILVGALVGSFLGFKGNINLGEGQTSDTVMLAGGKSALKLPFSLRCDKFTVSFYNTGAPKEYKSDLAVIENGRKVFSRSILVNHPLTFRGITFYQSTYGTVLKQAAIELTDKKSGKKIELVLPFQQPVTIPGDDHLLFIADYQEDFMGFGRAIELAYGKVGQQKDFSARWILVDKPTFHGNLIGNYLVHVTRAEKTRFTGIEVKKDPGVWLVWVGFILLTVAIGLTFYSSHKKLWVCIEPDEKRKKTIVTLAGRANRNPHLFEEKFEHLRATLELRLKELPSPKEGASDKDIKGL
ncbi:MAG: cytochrome c biogenesis protein ResB [Syntrophobacteraceae bacterium]|nr:cytochrome c biogenesis protein ResB [Syntrophobacteraceae bacterium]